jgi:hypothetical protein
MDTIKNAFERRIDAGESLSASHRGHGAPGQAFTTREMINLERDTIQVMRTGQQPYPARVRGMIVASND